MRGVSWARMGAPVVVGCFVTPDVESSRRSQHRHALTAAGAVASPFPPSTACLRGFKRLRGAFTSPLAQKSNSYD